MKRTLMIFAALALVSLILPACCVPHVEVARVWVATPYEECDLNLQMSELPFDLALNVNRTDRPFGRYDGFNSYRPHVIFRNGSERELSAPINDRPQENYISFNRWTLDGSALLLNKQWEDPQHAMLEEVKREMLLDPVKYRMDILRVTLSGLYKNLTGRNPVSFYNSGVFFWPLNPSRIGFGAIVGKEMRTFLMDSDSGEGKESFTSASGFTYGTDASLDGRSYAFHAGYQVYIGDVETRRERHVETGYRFNFRPTWSPDSEWIAFFCGLNNYVSDICIADRKGENVKVLASRNGYTGVVPVIDGFDFHGGQSDHLVWSKDSRSVIYGALKGDSVELFQKDISTDRVRQLTYSEREGTRNVYPDVSPDGRYLLFHSDREGSRDLYYMDLQSLAMKQVTKLDKGCTSALAKWRPEVRS